MDRLVALLRGINVGGRKLPMAALRALCEEIGWRDVATYIQSGNVVFAADGEPSELEAALERAIAHRFALNVPVVVRTASHLGACLEGNPFPEAARDEPNRLLLLLSKRLPQDGAQAALEARAVAGEKVGRAGDGLWIWYRERVGTSKLTPNLIDRVVGSPATGRNYRTVAKIVEMLTIAD